MRSLRRGVRRDLLRGRRMAPLTLRTELLRFLALAPHCHSGGLEPEVRCDTRLERAGHCVSRLDESDDDDTGEHKTILSSCPS
jgi:hypothetical protein